MFYLQAKIVSGISANPVNVRALVHANNETASSTITQIIYDGTDGTLGDYSTGVLPGGTLEVTEFRIPYDQAYLTKYANLTIKFKPTSGLPATDGTFQSIFRVTLPANTIIAIPATNYLACFVNDNLADKCEATAQVIEFYTPISMDANVEYTLRIESRGNTNVGF